MQQFLTIESESITLRSKVIIIEGIPGSGKTSTAKYVKQLLDRHRVPNRLFLEGDRDHPADYESVAWLDAEAYSKLIKDDVDRLKLLEPYVQPAASGVLIAYGKLANHPHEGHNQDNAELRELIELLHQSDVYNLPLEKFQTLLIDKWQSFAERVRQSEEVFILECCFIQNPMTLMFGRFNEPLHRIATFVQSLEDTMLELNPKLVYLYQDRIEPSFRRVMEERPEAWLKYITWYYTEQGYGKAAGLRGTEGLLQALETRKRYELELVQTLSLSKRVINNSEPKWDEVLAEIEHFVLDKS